MATRGKDEVQGFLSRWSQRKRAAEEAAPAPAEAASPEPAPAEVGDAAGEPGAVDVAALPDIDTLEAGADFTVFMRKGVPEELKQRALRRLWRVDPAFKHICMLDDYNLDYTDAATVVPNLKTIYQVGRGMVLPEEEVAEAAVDQLPPDATPPDATAVQAASQEPPAVAPEPAAAREPGGPRKPGTPLVSPPPTPTPEQAATSARPRAKSASREAAASARRRRWGDAES